MQHNLSNNPLVKGRSQNTPKDKEEEKNTLSFLILFGTFLLSFYTTVKSDPEGILWQVVQERRVVFVGRRLQELQVEEKKRRSEVELKEIGNSDQRLKV